MKGLRFAYFAGLAFFLAGALGIVLARFERAGFVTTGLGWGLDITLPCIALIIMGAVTAFWARKESIEAGSGDLALEKDAASAKKVTLAFGLFFFVVGVLGLLMVLLQDMGVIAWGFGSMLGFMAITFMGGVIILISRRS